MIKKIQAKYLEPAAIRVSPLVVSPEPKLIKEYANWCKSAMEIQKIKTK